MTVCNSSIAILMATFNGERYISEQLDSIISQTYSDWTLFVNDDGSTDSTIAIVEKYAARDPRIKLLHLQEHGDACKNFLSLLHEVDAPYFMFCDQDDIWHRDKIEISLAAMRMQEKLLEPGNNGAADKTKPTIIHTDLCMVDACGKCIATSFWKYSRIVPEAITEYRNYAGTCVATGCTMLFNKQAKECVRFEPKHARMHDAWVTLCVAKANGIVHALHEQTIDYRQHSDNAIGAPDTDRRSLAYKICNLRKIVSENYRQYMMLEELGYPGILTYIKEKIRYHRLS